MSNSICKHCPTADHGDIVCDCGHSHSGHVFADGCQYCDCDRYSQVKQVLATPPVIMQQANGNSFQIVFGDGIVYAETIK
jgi:peptide methionine sulfoxide reductase MsrB